MFDSSHFNTLYSPKDMFQYVCDCIGEHYQAQGMKYARSRPKLSWKTKKLKYQLGFWSSHSNIPGQYVNFEVESNIWAIDTHGMSRNGILSFPFFYLHEPDDLCDITILNWDGSKKHHALLNPDDTPTLIMAKSCNLQGCDAAVFQHILKYIDKNICILQSLETKEGIEKYFQMISLKENSLILDCENTKKYIERIYSE